ncbi:3-methyladenine DNA glycosylase [Saccharobesus litoralis]|uniref:3-methyladenine DNA glycosylase n=1 Tax=Saccharobesus litoralis TaxID=2172099 RepID=A0A2S0VQT0_9ALTE|nr:DNA-3-methyladenine glycosylase I [Saccharobesus litoralis]AWB66571.1 3-methyladenine DNA glycosylase [Saccharobesus litoralis]
MEKFTFIFERAAERKGGEASVMARVAKPLSSKQIAQYDDSQLLAEMSKKVFQSGFVWRVVEQKWPGFEEVFFDFNIEKILMMPAEMLERKASDERIIRNYRKVLSIRENAQLLHELQLEHGSAAKWLAEWPTHDIVGLWRYLKKNGSRLGGNTGPYALRKLGKDTFLFSQDVEAYLRAQKIIDGGIGTNKTLNAAQDAFNVWQQESGLSFQEISQVIAMSVGDNYV